MKVPKLHFWIPAFNRFLLLSLLLLLLIVLIRAIDLAMIGQLPVSPAVIIPRALWADVLTFFSIIRWIAIPYLLLYMFVSKRAGDIFYLTLIILYAIISFALNLYFQQTNVPLGADLYGYSMQDIRQTVGAAAGGGLPLVTIIGLAAVLIAAVVPMILLYRKKINGDRRGFWFVLLAVFFFWIPVSKALTRSGVRSEFAGNIILNKTGYFLTRSQQYFFPSADGGEGLGEEMAADTLFRVQYVQPDKYPFLHTPAGNTLLPYFRKGDRAPNVVIVLVEGLGRAFSGQGAYLGSFTPFLDSLAGSSLYWENFLSGGGRTFAVLPSILGSLPFGQNGFAEMAPDLPNALTLMNLAKHNGYRTQFMYAGEAGFDKMDQFVKNQGVDTIIDKNSFGEGYELLPVNSGGFTWGYSDEALFRKYLDATPVDSLRPRLDVMLTVSTHSPFKIPNQARYDAMAEQRIRSLGLTEEQQAAHLQYKAVYASVLYMDESLRGLFQQLQQRPDYANTIVLVTGDHRLPEIPMRSRIDRYHTLLLMHSPLLQRTAKFSSISSHMDVAPSLTGLLQAQYGFAAPPYVTWVGSGLDTARTFRNVHQYPLMQTKNDLSDYVAGTYLLNSGSLFKILPNMDLEPDTDEDMAGKLEAGLGRYRKKNGQLVQTKQLLPDSLYRQYVNK